jgi:hypothetical protein
MIDLFDAFLLVTYPGTVFLSLYPKRPSPYCRKEDFHRLNRNAPIVHGKHRHPFRTPRRGVRLRTPRHTLQLTKDLSGVLYRRRHFLCHSSTLSVHWLPRANLCVGVTSVHMEDLAHYAPKRYLCPLHGHLSRRRSSFATGCCYTLPPREEPRKRGGANLSRSKHSVGDGPILHTVHEFQLPDFARTGPNTVTTEIAADVPVSPLTPVHSRTVLEKARDYAGRLSKGGSQHTSTGTENSRDPDDGEITVSYEVYRTVEEAESKV